MKRLLTVSVAVSLAASVFARDVECIAIYYPHWHRYPKGIEWFGEKWKAGEWELVRTARPRFPGNKSPLRPLYGFLDGKDPNDVAKEIDLASNAGIDVFMYDWYWYGGEMTMQESLEEGFLKAPNRSKMKFCLMWCYHDRVDSFRDDPRQPKRMLMKLPRTKEDFLANIRYCRKFFHEPNHWMRDGKPFFSIYNAPAFVEDMGGPEKVRTILDEARAIAVADGLKGIYFQGMNPHWQRGPQELADAGFDCLGTYSLADCPEAQASKKDGTCLFQYADLVREVKRKWDLYSQTDVPYIPSIAAGRDTTMRCRNEEPFPWKVVRYPYSPICQGNTPDLFQEALASAKRHAENDPKKPGAVLVYGWNEYTEGGYIAPNNFDADGALRAVAAVFGRKPANEYTYVNPSSRKLYTIPAADRENVPYGTHAKQKVDLFLPKTGTGPYPVLMYIHGGGWSCGAMEDHVLGTSIRMLLESGVAVIGTGYRYTGDCILDGVKPPVQGCLDDCEAAVRFVQSKAKEWNLDVSRLALAGGSAGACTALYLGFKDDNALGIKALAPVIPQTSIDPKEMREWIPNSTYGAHAFGYRNFDDWLAHRDECLADINRISPAELLRRIDAKKAPIVVFQAGRLPKPGELAGDATHSPVFCAKFKEIADAKGVTCEFIQGGRLPCFGEAFVRIAEILTGRKVATARFEASAAKAEVQEKGWRSKGPCVELKGDRLKVSVPPDSEHFAFPNYVQKPIDLAPYAGKKIRILLKADIHDLKPSKPGGGLKYMLYYVDATTRKGHFIGCPQMTGSAEGKDLVIETQIARDPLPGALMTVGIRDAYGELAADLSKLDVQLLKGRDE